MTTRITVQPGVHDVEVTYTEHHNDDVREHKTVLSVGCRERHFHIHSGHHVTVREILPPEPRMLPDEALG